MKMRPGGADWGGGLPGWGSGRVRQAVGRVQGLLAARLTDLAEVLLIERQGLINGPAYVEHCSRRYRTRATRRCGALMTASPSSVVAGCGGSLLTRKSKV